MRPRRPRRTRAGWAIRSQQSSLCIWPRKAKVSAAVDPAKKYIVRAMVHPFKIGKGNGPLNHNVAI